MDAPTILIVDDDRHIARLLGYALLRAGYQVEFAYNGEQALAHLRRCCPALVFLDVMMPGMDGVTVCRHLRQDPANAGAYVIMLTALGQPADRERAARRGGDEYMLKPFSPHAVTQRVRELLPLSDLLPPAPAPP